MITVKLLSDEVESWYTFLHIKAEKPTKRLPLLRRFDDIDHPPLEEKSC